MLLRLLVTAVLAGGPLFSAEQQLPFSINMKPDTLPPPLSSAIQHMVTGKWPKSKSMDLFSQAPPLLLAEQAPGRVQRCSIPLQQHKIPDGVRFFIERMPAPNNSTQIERMPVVHAPICGEPSSANAH